MAAPTVSAPAGITQRVLGQRKADIRGAVFHGVLLTTLLLTLLVLVVLVVDVFVDGRPVLAERGWSFVTSPLSRNAAIAGVGQSIRGTLLLSAVVALVAFPLGIGAAVYLEEYARDTWLTRAIMVNIRNLAGVPSIVYGILGLKIFVQIMQGATGGRTVISGGLTLAVLVLPIVVITTQEALRAVPLGIREAAYGVGATQWETTRSHVLPYAAPGILTGTVLSLARAAGETAPLILVGAATFYSAGDQSFFEQLRGPFTALPYTIFSWSRQPPEFRPNVAGAIIVLLAVIFLVNATAILLRNRYERKW